MGPAEKRSSGGSALIVVLWVIGLMSLLVGSLAFEAHMEAKITSYYRKRTKAQYLAQSGLAIAEMLMIKRNEIGNDQDEPEEEGDRWFDAAKQLKKGAVRGLVETLGEGTVTLDIVPEPARRNINNLDTAGNKNLLEVERNLERILDVGGITEEMEMWPDLIESFLDWIDGDDAARMDGAETEDYYATLEPPYTAKNGLLDTVGELLLIRGFTKTILNGGTLDVESGQDEKASISGIADLLTVYGNGKVDINAASARVLMTLPDVDEIVAGAIIEEREGLLDADGQQTADYFNSVAELYARIPDLPKTIQQYLTVGSGIFRITCVGDVGGVQRKVWCVASFDAQTKKLKILRWREED